MYISEHGEYRHTHVHTRMHTHVTDTNTQAYTHKWLHTHSYIHTSLHIFKHSNTRTYIHTHIQTHVRTCKYCQTYIHACTLHANTDIWTEERRIYRSCVYLCTSFICLRVSMYCRTQRWCTFSSTSLLNFFHGIQVKTLCSKGRGGGVGPVTVYKKEKRGGKVTNS